MKRRILSSLMALVLVFGLLPTTAFAEGETPDAEPEVTAVEAPSAEEGETQLAAPKVKIGDSEYKTLDKALKDAQDGATIQLGEGNYATYIAEKQPNYSGKNLTFEGKGNKTVWQIGAKNPNPDLLGTEYNGDYSFDGRGTVKEETVTFRNINFYVGTENYLGFIGIDNFVLENCTVNGIMTYGGTKTAKYEGVVFNAPTYAKNKKIDYSFYSIDGDVVTFKDCTFNGDGKFINVYTHYEENDVIKTINFDSCTVNSTGNNKQPLNIKNGDSTRDTKRTVNWTINISGKIHLPAKPRRKISRSMLPPVQDGSPSKRVLLIQKGINSSPLTSTEKPFGKTARWSAMQSIPPMISTPTATRTMRLM